MGPYSNIKVRIGFFYGAFMARQEFIPFSNQGV
jgi:hypothetical protein